MALSGAAMRLNGRNVLITVPMFTHGTRNIYAAFGTRWAVPAEEDGGQAVRVNQVHGTDILVIDRPGMDRESAGAGHDALVTDQPGLLLTVRTADCVPILLLDPVRGVVAAVHAGWRGSLSGIVTKTVDVMRTRFGCRPDSLRAAIGPAIGACCYQVDDAVLKPLKQQYADWMELVSHVRGRRGYLDLRRLNRRQLEEAGLSARQIDTVSVCTACHPELLYSYRRDGKGTRHMTSGIALVADRRWRTMNTQAWRPQVTQGPGAERGRRV